MKPSKVPRRAPQAVLALIAVAAGLAASALQAQPVYRIVGPDGKVTFSDRPLAAETGAAKGGTPTTGAGTAGAQTLPYELRQAVQKYPVVLYTSADCAPCGAGRALLTGRGIPFSEKTVATAADSQALQRLSGETSLPFLTIGSQQLKGFSDAEWSQFLDAAGYPKSSILPASYRAPAPSALATVAPAPASAPAASAEPRPAPSALPVQTPASPGNPAGIKF